MPESNQEQSQRGVNPPELLKIRHTAEHVLMQAMETLGYKLHKALGPATEDGFYFDFELLEGSITEEDFPKIEAAIDEIIKRNLPLTRVEVPADTARTMFANNPYKQAWINEAAQRNEPISIYWTGEPNHSDSFVDLCAGPHVAHTGEIGAVKLLSIAGAYWRGDEHNQMLTRIYGTAFPTLNELNEYLSALEQRKANDHRVLGQKLDLFAFSEIVGKGLVMYTPKGTVLKNELKNALLQISKRYGVQEVNIPHMAKIDLYKTSGHADKFMDELFRVISHYGEEFVLKPVNCPHHTQIYASQPRSYRDLPIRYIESTQQHRDEKPGAIGGLNRTRSFEIDDGHTFCTPEQIKQEAINTIKIIEEFYSSLGMWGHQWVSLSFRNPETPDKYIGDLLDWEKAERILEEINSELALNAKIMLGEAALYGPKIDFMFKDALGNDRQLGTVQVDFAMPQRFGLKYTAPDGSEKTPVMLHRAILGSYGRFIANLIESTGGAFPVWLTPVQVEIITVNDQVIEYANEVRAKLLEHDIRVELNDRNSTMQSKIRNAQEQKTPYMFIIGPKEVQNKTVNVRTRDEKQLGEMSTDQAILELKSKINSKSLSP